MHYMINLTILISINILGVEWYEGLQFYNTLGVKFRGRTVEGPEI